MARSAVVLVLAVAGCDLAFPPDLGDGATPGYRLTVDVANIGAQVVDVPADVAAGSATYLVEQADAPDGFTRVPAEVVGAGTWFAPIADGEAATLQFTIPETPYPHVWSFPARALVARPSLLHRPGAALAPAGQTVSVTATLGAAYSSGDALTVLAVGAWASRGAVGVELPPVGGMQWSSPALAYDTFTPLAGTRYQITTDDVVAVLRHDTTGRLIGALIAQPLEQVAGDPTNLFGTIAVVPSDLVAAFTIDPAAAAARFSPARPAVASPTSNWAVVAAPGASVGVAAGVQLVARVTTPADSPDVETHYGNPTPWPSLIRWTATASRAMTPAGETQVASSYSGLITFAAGAIGGDVSLTQPLPTAVTIGGIELATDDMTVLIDRSRPVEISYTLDGPAVGLCAAVLYELVPGATQLERVPRLELYGTTPRWRIPADLLVPGVLYSIRASQYPSGFPGIAAGDLSTRALPLQLGYLDSGLFRVP